MPTNDLRKLISDPLVIAFLKNVIVYGETLVIYAISDSEDLMDNPEIASIVKEWEEDKLTSEEADKKLLSFLPFSEEDFQDIESDLCYMDGDPMDVTTFTFKGKAYRICLYHSSWGDGEDFDGSQLEAGTFVPKTIMEFVTDEDLS